MTVSDTYAHTPGPTGQWHLLADHLAGTAERAAAFAQPFDAAELARVAGWLHDAGKCSCAFSAYLRACAADGDDVARRAFPKRDHKTAGAVRAASLDKTIGPLLATTILGHHGGMPDLDDVRSRLESVRDDPNVSATLAAFDAAIGLAPFALSTVGPPWTRERPNGRAEKDAFVRDVEMLWRLVFSALVDADFLDTEAHFNREVPQRRAGDRDLAGLSDRFESRRYSATNSPVNRARGEMYDAVLAKASMPPGLYSLAAPTGAGKTQIGLGWALAHAKAHDLRRVVTAVPFITVTDQVASVYRELVDDPSDQVVVEHHSQVTGDDGWQKLASENWDAPVIVTTTVRLFESLFSNGPSDCRRLHRLAKSVIVLDEAQTIPVEVLDPVVDALRALVDRFGSTVLIMTATQPTLEHVRPTSGRPAIPLLPDPDRWSSTFLRTDIRLEGKVTRADVAGMVGRHRQCLCIVNTIEDAQEITKKSGDRGIRHLSTRLRPADRRARIKEIRQLLDAGDDCRVVSTQLVEAGVDLDFPVVLRAMGPLPSLAQADGRCNRNGMLTSGLGQTIIFDLVDGAALPPGAYYRYGTLHTQVMFARGEPDFRDPGTISEWYGQFLSDQAVLQDSRKVQEARLRLQFKTTAERFRMIDDETVSVAVPWPKDDRRAPSIERLLDLLRNKVPLQHREARILQDVTVSLRPRQAEQAYQQGLAERVTDHLLVWTTGEYDSQIGLILTKRSRGDVIL